MNLDKSSATHVWTPAVKLSVWGIEQLSLYKKVDGQWWVFSSRTGWRLSVNDQNWFKTERKEGYFRKLKKDERNELTK